MVSEPERVTREEQEQSCQRRPVGPAKQEHERQRDEDRVQGVHFCDDRLAPEAVRRGEEQRGSDGCGERSGQLDRRQRQNAAGDGAFDRGSQIQGVRRIARHQQQECAADGEVQRIGGARRDDRRSHRGLKGPGIAEVDAGQQRRSIERKRREPDDDRGRQAAAHWYQWRRFRASWARTSSSDRVLTTC